MSNLFTPNPVVFSDGASTPVVHTYSFKYQDTTDKTAGVVGVWNSMAASGDIPAGTTYVKHNFKAKDLRRSLLSDKFDADATKLGVVTQVPATFNFTSTTDRNHDIEDLRARFDLFVAKLADPKFFEAFVQGFID